MGVDTVQDLSSVWQAVRLWPPQQRLALATRILQSLQQEAEAVSVPKERQEALNKLIGIWKTDHPPSDEEVERVVEEERLKKYD